MNERWLGGVAFAEVPIDIDCDDVVDVRGWIPSFADKPETRQLTTLEAGGFDEELAEPLPGTATRPPRSPGS